MQTRLKDTVVLVTGAGSGIGLAIAQSLLEEGARVVAADLDPTEAVDGIAESRAIGVAVDLSCSESGETTVAAAVQRFGSSTPSSHSPERWPTSSPPTASAATAEACRARLG